MVMWRSLLTHAHCGVPVDPQELLESKETECAKLRADNDELVARVMDEKMKAVAELNAMNEVVETARRRGSVRMVAVVAVVAVVRKRNTRNV